MTSTQVLIGLFWLPGLICLFFIVVKLCDWFVDMFYQQKLSGDWMPDTFGNHDDYITDGFGSYWWAFCQVCNKRSMVVVKPGKVECEYGCESAKSDHLTDKEGDNGN